jgi:hypothetical protein
VLGIGALVGEVAGVDFFADDATDYRGRCSAGLLDVLNGERAGGDAFGLERVGGDAGVIGPGFGVLDERGFILLERRVLQIQ